MDRIRRGTAVCITLIGLMLSNAHADIVIDTSLDGGFFTQNPMALTALNAAASDLNALIDFNLGAVDGAPLVGTDQGTTATFDFSYSIRNPTTDATVTFNDTALPAGEVRIFAGARNIGGNTLGRGGPGGAGFSATGSSNGTGTFQNAINDAIANSTLRRGGGPVIGNLNRTFNSGETASFDYGPAYGNVYFDNDTNNDGMTDTATELNASWNFDVNQTSFPGQDDFYSVALHEMTHALGFGISETWDDLVAPNGTDWLGSEVISLLGSGAGLINDDHIADGFMSVSLETGLSQEPLMNDSILRGTRKSLTQLDAAFLRDLGYSTTVTAVPEPGSMMLTSVALGGIAYRRRRRSKG